MLDLCVCVSKIESHISDMTIFVHGCMCACAQAFELACARVHLHMWLEHACMRACMWLRRACTTLAHARLNLRAHVHAGQVWHQAICIDFRSFRSEKYVLLVHQRNLLHIAFSTRAGRFFSARHSSCDNSSASLLTAIAALLSRL